MQRLSRVLLSACLLCFLSGCSAPWLRREVPFVPTPPEVVDRMLELAAIKEGDVVYDLGSGDGRIVIRAAEKYGVKGVGIEIDAELVRVAREIAARQGVAHLVEFRAENALAVDVSGATVVTLYMLPEFNAKLRPILERQLRPGSRVVSHDFDIDGWTPTKVERMYGGWHHTHSLLLWTIP